MTDFNFVTSHIPHVMQSLYVEELFNSTSLKEIRDAFRVDQIKCKSWLLERLENVSRDSKILVVGSWLGFTSYCLYKMGFEYITETDPDSRLEQLACHINRDNQNFLHLSKDVNEIDLSEYDLIINTSCEHIWNDNWFNNIKSGTLVVLQSTNMKSEDHVNTVGNLKQMEYKYELCLEYSGELFFNDRFSRYMLCGKKP